MADLTSDEIAELRAELDAVEHHLEDAQRCILLMIQTRMTTNEDKEFIRAAQEKARRDTKRRNKERRQTSDAETD